MSKYDILNSGVPLSLDKTKNYVKNADGSVTEIADLASLATNEIGFIGHKSHIHKILLADRNISVLDEKKADVSYVDTEIANLVNSAPATLDTLNEIATALNNDADFYNTITGLINGKEDTLPTGTNGQLLTYNTVNGWEAQDAPVSLPDQTGANGQYLTSDGSTASWATIDTDWSMNLDTVASGETLTIPAGKQMVVDHLDVQGDLDVQGTLATTTGGSLSQTTMKTQVIENPTQGNGLTINETATVNGSVIAYGGVRSEVNGEAQMQLANSNRVIYDFLSADGSLSGVYDSTGLKFIENYDYTNDVKKLYTAGVPRLLIDSTGAVRMPYQPHVRARANQGGPHLVSANTPVICNVVDVNIGGGYNGTTGVFTAPVTGRYLFNWNILHHVPSAGDGDVRYYVNGTNIGYAGYHTNLTSGADYMGRSHQIIYELAAGDTMELRALSDFSLWADGSHHTFFTCSMIA